MSQVDTRKATEIAVNIVGIAIGIVLTLAILVYLIPYVIYNWKVDK